MIAGLLDDCTCTSTLGDAGDVGKPLAFKSLGGFSLEAARAGTSGGGVGETVFDGGSTGATGAAGAGAEAEVAGAGSSRGAVTSLVSIVAFSIRVGDFTSVAGFACACACTCDDPVSGSACLRGRMLRPGSESFEVSEAAFSFHGVRAIWAIVLGSSLELGATVGEEGLQLWEGFLWQRLQRLRWLQRLWMWR